jgi:hypothetical protein
VTEESPKALRHRAEQLSHLAAVEAFKVLRGECEKTAGRIAEQLKDLLLAPGPTEPVNQRLIDYNRGYIAGMRHATTDVPSGAARTLQRLEQNVQDAPSDVDYWSYQNEGDDVT